MDDCIKRVHEEGTVWDLTDIGRGGGKCVGLHLQGAGLHLGKMSRNSYTFADKMKKCRGIPTHLVEKCRGSIHLCGNV